eukprot:CAMPEP_0114558852 /NCGR_PEP_ID=MMETSP0114-20121206/10608_1 /TAXON_ID=31324 /ORGANISM="Goniomonas sp, Strain m" /LENGTH=329 /DNA_ID=CAMNT_0001744281 /DNA_START=84 /DNA_END=1073 /DNA_ORIENTATION=+
MTYGATKIRNVVNYKTTGALPKPMFGANWAHWQNQLWGYAIGCHLGHSTDFLVGLICYLFFFPIDQAKEWKANWVLQVVAFNLACEFIICTFWHWLTYVGPYSKGNLQKQKYNPDNQYEKSGNVGFFSSSSRQLQREVFLTTLGWLQSALFQCVVMWLWASGKCSYYTDFWAHPVWSLGWLLFITYWREFHFYWCHRMIHPWKWEVPLLGDVGQFLYTNFHSIHHKSYNPGPWSGLSMHPVEHFFYYSSTLVVLCFSAHPMHFLYVKFHADIAPISGHDGYAEPAGGADFHWLHHAKFECNYGVPLIDFDRLFGTWLDYEDYKKQKAAK